MMSRKLLYFILPAAAVASVWAMDAGCLFKTGQAHAANPVAREASSIAGEMPSPEDREKSLLFSLQNREKEIAKKEEELRLKEERLASVQKDIDSRIAELNAVHDKISAFVRKIDEVNEERIKRLVKIYESMPPEDAATRVEKLDEDLAVLILAPMAEKKAAKILAKVEPIKAARLSKLLKVK